MKRHTPLHSDGERSFELGGFLPLGTAFSEAEFNANFEAHLCRFTPQAQQLLLGARHRIRSQSQGGEDLGITLERIPTSPAPARQTTSTESTATSNSTASTAISNDEAEYWTLSLRRRYLHSKRDPRREGVRKVSTDEFARWHGSLCLLGADLLYSLEALSQRHVSEDTGGVISKLIFFVEHVEILALALGTRRLGFFEFLESPADIFVLDGEARDLFRQGSQRARLEQAFMQRQGTPASPQRETLLETLASPRWTFLPTAELELARQAALRKDIEGFLQDLYEQSVRSLLTRYIFEKLWLRNTLSNLRHGKTLIPLSHFYARHKEKRAVLIGAGPSLDEVEDELRTFLEEAQSSSRPVIMAIDTALPALKRMGIVPDYIVALDAGYYNVLDFTMGTVGTMSTKRTKESQRNEDAMDSIDSTDSMDSTDSTDLMDSTDSMDSTESRGALSSVKPPINNGSHPILLAHIGVHPIIFRRYPGKIVCFCDEGEAGTEKSFTANENAAHSLTSGILSFTGLSLAASALRAHGSVLHSGLSALAFMGCERVLMYGVDLSCPGMRAHATGTIHDRILHQQSHRFQSWESEAFRYLLPTLVPQKPSTSQKPPISQKSLILNKSSISQELEESSPSTPTTHNLTQYAHELEKLLPELWVAGERPKDIRSSTLDAGSSASLEASSQSSLSPPSSLQSELPAQSELQRRRRMNVYTASAYTPTLDGLGVVKTREERKDFWTGEKLNVNQLQREPSQFDLAQTKHSKHSQGEPVQHPSKNRFAPSLPSLPSLWAENKQFERQIHVSAERLSQAQETLDDWVRRGYRDFLEAKNPLLICLNELEQINNSIPFLMPLLKTYMGLIRSSGNSVEDAQSEGDKVRLIIEEGRRILRMAEVKITSLKEAVST